MSFVNKGESGQSDNVILPSRHGIQRLDPPLPSATQCGTARSLFFLGMSRGVGETRLPFLFLFLIAYF